MRPQRGAAYLADLVVLRREAKQLRDQLTRDKAARRQLQIDRIIDGAALSAGYLVAVHVGGGCTGRELCGLPARRWAYGVALLRMAGLASGHDVRLQLPKTPEDTARRIDDAAADAKRHPYRFAARVPPSLRPKVLRAARGM